MELRKLLGTRPIIMTGACVILVNQENQILLQLRKDNGLWGLPGGSMEPGESLKEVAAREVFEETGLEALDLKLFDVFSGQELYYQYPHGDEVYNVVVAYICSEYSGTMKAEDSEVHDLRFFHVDGIPNGISPPDKPIIEKYIRDKGRLQHF